jgi:hypothetical protein
MRMSLVFPMVLSLPSFGLVLVNEDHQHGAGDAEQLGSVEFANSCSAEVQPQFPGRGDAALLLVRRNRPPVPRGRRR